MNSGQTIFSQLLDFVPRYEFRLCVERYCGDYKVQSFSCWDQFLTLAFAQLTYRESLRDIGSVPSIDFQEALSHGYSWQSVSQHSCPRQSSP